MKDLDKALADITAIRSQLARGTEFRGYGPVTVAATGLLALFAAALQAMLLPDPAANAFAYLMLWTGMAALAVVITGAEMIARTRRIHGGFADEMTDAVRISYSQIPHFASSTAVGHAGQLVLGTIGGVPVAVQQGRFHFYEGYDMAQVMFPMRTFGLMGVKTVILTNAAGSVRTSMKAREKAEPAANVRKSTGKPKRWRRETL